MHQDQLSKTFRRRTIKSTYFVYEWLFLSVVKTLKNGFRRQETSSLEKVTYYQALKAKRKHTTWYISILVSTSGTLYSRNGNNRPCTHLLIGQKTISISHFTAECGCFRRKVSRNTAIMHNKVESTRF